MENEPTLPPAMERLLEAMPLPNSITATHAAALLGGGAPRVREVLDSVAGARVVSWSHSPREGDLCLYINHKFKTETWLPRVTPGTDPDTVLVDGDAILLWCCVQFERLLHAPEHPPMEAVENRVKFVHEMARVRALGRKTAAQTVSAAVPTETSEQRQDRRLQACVDAGMLMQDTKAVLHKMPAGIGRVAREAGVTRQAFTDDVKAALKRRLAIEQGHGTVHRTR